MSCVVGAAELMGEWKNECTAFAYDMARNQNPFELITIRT